MKYLTLSFFVLTLISSEAQVGKNKITILNGNEVITKFIKFKITITAGSQVILQFRWRYIQIINGLNFTIIFLSLIAMSFKGLKSLQINQKNYNLILIPYLWPIEECIMEINFDLFYICFLKTLSKISRK